jgi:hypothetical protein
MSAPAPEPVYSLHAVLLAVQRYVQENPLPNLVAREPITLSIHIQAPSTTEMIEVHFKCHNLPEVKLNTQLPKRQYLGVDGWWWGVGNPKPNIVISSEVDSSPLFAVESLIQMVTPPLPHFKLLILVVSRGVCESRQSANEAKWCTSDDTRT